MDSNLDFILNPQYSPVECGESQLLVLRSSPFPTPDTILYCKGPHVHVCGPLCLYILILSIASCKQPPLGHCQVQGSVNGQFDLPLGGQPREEVHVGALEVGFGSFGQGILECGLEGDQVYTQRRPVFLTSWHIAGRAPEWSLPKHSAQGRGHQYNDVSVSSVSSTEAGLVSV